jgi:hypothetical protein
MHIGLKSLNVGLACLKLVPAQDSSEKHMNIDN